MSPDPTAPDPIDPAPVGPADLPEGLEGYPYASPEAESRIKLVTSLLSVTAVGMLCAGLYLSLFTTAVGVGALLALVGFVDLMLVPFLAKRLRAAALQRERGGAGGSGSGPQVTP